MSMNLPEEDNEFSVLEEELAAIETQNKAMEDEATAAELVSGDKEAATVKGTRCAELRRHVSHLEREVDAARVDEMKQSHMLERATSAYTDMCRNAENRSERILVLVEGLRHLVEEKLNATSNVEVSKDNDHADAQGDLDFCNDLSADRERELSHASRVLRETEAAIELKEKLVHDIHEQGKVTLAEKKKERAEMVKRLVFQCQDERNALHMDVSELLKANAEAAHDLHKGKLACRKEKVTLGTQSRTKSSSSSSSAVGGPRPSRVTTIPREETQPTETEKEISGHVGDVEKEVQELHGRLHDLQKERTETARATQTAEMRCKRDRDSNSAELRELEARVVAEVAKVKRYELDNSRMSEQLAELSHVLKQTKTSIERARGDAVVLPTEADFASSDEDEDEKAPIEREAPAESIDAELQSPASPAPADEKFDAPAEQS